MEDAEEAKAFEQTDNLAPKAPSPEKENTSPVDEEAPKPSAKEEKL